jgi:hypothetical protein
MKLKLWKSNNSQVKGLECLNCGQPLNGSENFCSYCGQKNTTAKLSFSIFLNNIFSGFFSYDSRFWKTLLPLLFKPGIVSKQYIEGKRERFVNPFQLYLHVSIIFFLVFGISENYLNNSNNSELPIKIENDSIVVANEQSLDSVFATIRNEVTKNIPEDSVNLKNLEKFEKFVDVVQDEAKKPHAVVIDTAANKSITGRIGNFQKFYTLNPNLTTKQALDTLNLPSTFWNTFYYEQVIKTNKNVAKIREDGGRDFLEKLLSYIPISLFVFLPLFTLFLKLIYIRKNLNFMEHLVFVFHLQTVFFIMYLLFYLLGLIFKIEEFLGTFFIIFLLYLYKALRNFYQQKRGITILNFLLLNTFYFTLATIAFFAVTVVSFYST